MFFSSCRTCICTRDWVLPETSYGEMSSQSLDWKNHGSMDQANILTKFACGTGWLSLFPKLWQYKLFVKMWLKCSGQTNLANNAYLVNFWVEDSGLLVMRCPKAYAFSLLWKLHLCTMIWYFLRSAIVKWAVSH